jgi:gas vesicle protein
MPRETESFYLDDDSPQGIVSFLAGAGLGMVLGAGFAFALAPAAGQVTRRKLGAAVLRARDCLARRLRRCTDVGDLES